MTALQRSALRLSEIRSELNELNGLEELTDEQRAQRSALTAEYGTAEDAWRAEYIAAEGVDPNDLNPQETEEDAEVRERNALLDRVEIRHYLDSAASGAPLPTELRELNDAFGISGEGVTTVPFEVLAHNIERYDAEHRQDQATTTAQLEGATGQRPVLYRLFGMGVKDFMGVRLDSVPSGMMEWPLMTGGVSPKQVAESTAQDAEQATFETQVLKPKRLTARYLYTVEQAAQVRNLETVLRTDLNAAINDAQENQVINGDGTGANVRGFFAAYAAAAVPNAVVTRDGYYELIANGIDGLHAHMEGDVRLLTSIKGLRKAITLRQPNSDRSVASIVRDESGGFMASTHVADATSGNRQNVSDVLTRRGNAPGSSVAAVWPGLQLIRDPYTNAAKGQIAITAGIMWDFYAGLRTAAYTRSAIKTA